MEATEMIFTADGRRLDVLLSEQSGLTRSRVATLMEEGRVTVDGVAVTNLDILQEITYASTVGQELQATFYREGREITLTLIMGEEQH